jgi:hypothetical protein
MPHNNHTGQLSPRAPLLFVRQGPYHKVPRMPQDVGSRDGEATPFHPSHKDFRA